MSGPNLPQLPTQSQSILSTGKVAPVSIRPNASLTNVSQAAVEALISSARQGPVRGQVVRENRDDSYTVRTKDGEVQIKPQPPEQLAGTPATPAPHFKAGDPVQLEFPVDSLRANALSSGKPLEVQVSLLNSTALLEEGIALAVRASETPLRVEVNITPLQGEVAPISARLEAIPAGMLAEILVTITPNLIINQAVQNIDLKTETIINTIRSETALAPITVQNTAASTRTTEAAFVAREAGVPQVTIAAPPAAERAVAPEGTGESAPRATVLPLPTASEIRAIGQTVPVEGRIQIALRDTVLPSVQANKFNILPQTAQVSSATLTAPDTTQAAPAAPQTTAAHRAGHAVAQVVGFSEAGTPIVTLHTGQNAPAPTPQQGAQAAGASASSGGGLTSPAPQHYLLQTPQLSVQNLSVGTQVEIVPQSSAGGAAGLGATTLANPTAFFLAPGAWPVMTELAQTLEAVAPPVAQTLGNVTPSPTGGGAPAQIMPAAMLFIAAMRGGDMQSWMGHKMVETLRSAGKGDLLSRLGGEGQALGRMGAEPLAQDWRAMTLPFLTQGEMQKVALYYKHDEQDDENGESVKQTRFVFDMALSQMGKVQVDGLFRGKKLDLVVRTGDDLSPEMRQRMRGAYTDALELSGLSGELSFQNGERHYFSVAPQVDEFEGRV